MKPEDIKVYYRNFLPHLQPVGASFFVTFRLYGSIPRNALLKLKQDFEYSVSQLTTERPNRYVELIKNERKQFFKKYDQLLDQMKEGPHYLKIPEIARLVVSELHRFDGNLYDLYAFCIMSNHVHILIDTSIQVPESVSLQPFEELDIQPLQNIMKRIKGPVAVYANRILGRKGKFWQRESYDHYIRNGQEFGRIINYILENPVKAGLVKDWADWPFNFLKGFEDESLGK